MVPRFRPYLGKDEILAVFRCQDDALACFEDTFAQTFGCKHALAFSYGRSALWGFFQALSIQNAEIILPAYSCSVVAHAIVLSENTPRFVDITLSDYNMDLDQVEAAITERTRAIVATHLFGYPLDVDRLGEVVRAAEARWGHKIWIIQDCAHSFGARWQGKSVCKEGDAALFGLGISKMITSVFGGMLTTDDSELYSKLRTFRETHFIQPGLSKQLSRVLYLLAVYAAFNGSIYRLVNWIEEETTLLDGLAKAYHLDGLIHFPPDYLDQMMEFEAKIGLVQLTKYPTIIRRRQEHAAYYNQQLAGQAGIQLPPLVEGATYSHYVIRVRDRQRLLAFFRRHGVQLGDLIQYSIPHMEPYSRQTDPLSCPNSLVCSQSTVNLPVHGHLREGQREKIVELLWRTEALQAAPAS